MPKPIAAIASSRAVAAALRASALALAVLAGQACAQPAQESAAGAEPIIADDEFDAAIPPLEAGDDPELDQPLESLAEFERRIADAQAKAGDKAGSGPPAGQQAPSEQPMLADGDAASASGDASLRDVELAKPLPPLSEFDVQPVESAQGDQTETDAGIAYRTRLTGLDAADAETAAGLRAMFRELSALRRGDGKAASAAMVAARLAEDAALVQRILASEGWFGAQVATRIERDEGAQDQPIVAVIEASPGRRYALADIVVVARATVPENLIRDSLALRPGEPIVADRIQGAEAHVALALPQSGYPFAMLGERDILLNAETGEGVYTLPVDTGPRAIIAALETEGDLAFDAAHVAVLSRFRLGELYDSRSVNDLREALVATGLFAAVSAEPRRTGAPAGDGSEYVSVLVRQDAGPPRTIAGTLGYATGEGFRVNGSWTHRNLFPPEGALIAMGLAGTKEQGGGVTFRRSNAGRRDRTFELVAEALHIDYNAYSAYTGRLGARVSYASTPIWQKKTTYAYGINLMATGEKDFDFTRGVRNRQTYYVGGLNGQLGLDLTDDLLDPTRGARVSVLVEPEGSLNDGFHPYVRARLDASAYLSVGGQSVRSGVVLAGRVRLGTIQGAGRIDIAPSRRFYAGGGGSVRGFGYQKLGPQDPNGDPVGGRSLNEAAAEVRWRFGNYGLVGFVDVGQSYAADIPRFSHLRMGAGLGGRFYTNFGPVRLDVATPVNRRKGEARLNIYVSIGQSF